MFWFVVLSAVSTSLVLNVSLPGCSSTENPTPSPSPTAEPTPTPSAQARTCAGCHTDEDLLKEVATPLPPPAEDTGEG